MRNKCEQLSVSDSGMLGGECQPIICYSWASEGKLSHAFINDIHHTDQRSKGWGRGRWCILTTVIFGGQGRAKQ